MARCQFFVYYFVLLFLTYAAPYWASLHPFWTMLHPTDLRCTLFKLRRTLLSYGDPLWVTPQPTKMRCTLSELRRKPTELRCTLYELRRTLLNYAAPFLSYPATYWATLLPFWSTPHSTELRKPQPCKEMFAVLALFIVPMRVRSIWHVHFTVYSEQSMLLVCLIPLHTCNLPYY